MKWNYISYIALTLTILINIYYKVKHRKSNSEAIKPLQNQLMSIANWTIFANVIISTIAVILKLNSIIDFDKYLIAMFIVFILVILSSAAGIVSVIQILFETKKKTSEENQLIPADSRIKLFTTFAMFVFGAVWAATDTLLSFSWLDYISKLISLEPIQSTPIIGIFYIAIIYINSIFKINLFKFSLIRRKK